MDKSRMIHKNDEIKRRFLQVDMLLLENPLYEGMSEGAVLTYAILRNRMELSKKNPEVYSDDEGYLFLIFTDAELAQILHRKDRKTAAARKKELEKFGLIQTVRMGNQEPNRIYLLELETCDPEEYLSKQYRKNRDAEKAKNAKENVEKKLNKTFVLIEVEEETPTEEIHEEAETLGGVMMSKKRTSGCPKNGQQDVQKTDTNNTYIIKTDINNTENKNLNLNPVELNVYDVLSHAKIPHDLKVRIKNLIINQVVSLTAKDILLIEEAYHYQIETLYVKPTCSHDDPEALNDAEFSRTVEKMLRTVKGIKNMRGLIKEWVIKGWDFKKDWLHVTDLSDSKGTNTPLYNWLLEG